MIKSIFSIKTFVLAHKFITLTIFLVLLGGGYFAYNTLTSTAGETQYILVAAKKETVIDSVSGTGQVIASNQVELTSKISGTIISLPVPEGSNVGAGQIIAQLDSTIAQKAVRDAQANLDSAKLALEKLRIPADTLSVLQSENALVQAKESKQKAEADLKKAYEDGFTTVSNAFLYLPMVIAGLKDTLYGSSFGEAGEPNIDHYYNQTNRYDAKSIQYKNSATAAYQIAQKTYDQNFSYYKSATRFSDTGTIVALIDETYNTSQNVAEAVKSASNVIQSFQDALIKMNIKPDPISDTQLASLNTYTVKTNTDLLNLLAIKRTIQASKEIIVNADRTIAEKTEFLAKLKAGAIPLDIQAQQLTIKQRENALVDAEQMYADYTIRAPFSGTLGKVYVKKFNNVIAGTQVGTLVTKQLMAQVVLNEVAAAKVKVGDKATITFDALPELSMTGLVIQIDTVGTVSQGVVSYAVKIVFDKQDEHIKHGMSTSAIIISEERQDVVTVPNSAVKSRGDIQYVEILDKPTSDSTDQTHMLSTTPPREQNVVVGISDDANTEIISGLNDGDMVIINTVTADTQAPEQVATAPNIIPSGGGLP